MTKVFRGGIRCIARSCISLVLCTQVSVAADSPADCAAIESPDERLACFDAVYRDVEDAPVTDGSAPVDSGSADSGADVAGPATAAGAAAAVAASPNEAEFGLEKSRDETEGESLTSGIAAVGKDGYDKLLFELENGQLWRQTEYKRFPARAGQTAVIRHGSFGSYKLYIEGESRWTRVQRVD